MPTRKTRCNRLVPVTYKIFALAKGYRGRPKRIPRAKQAVMKAGQYAYRDRRQRKRQSSISGLSVSMQVPVKWSVLQQHERSETRPIEIDRKVLADLAVFDKAAFAQLVEKAPLAA